MTESTERTVLRSHATRGRAVERLVDVFYSPRAAFADINEAPSLLVPVIALAAIRLAGNLIYYSPSLAPAKFALTVLVNLLPVVVLVAIAGFVYWIGALMSGGVASLPLVSSIVAYSLMASEALGFLWALVEHFAGVPGAGSRGPIYSNLGFVVSPDNFALHRLLASVDVLALYYLALVWFGISRSVAQPTRSRIGVIVSLPWILV
jgi:hypothetical protein